jgi:hypothetical protein
LLSIFVKETRHWWVAIESVHSFCIVSFISTAAAELAMVDGGGSGGATTASGDIETETEVLLAMEVDGVLALAGDEAALAVSIVCAEEVERRCWEPSASRGATAASAAEDDSNRG